jgi:hypothetical protein
LPPEHAISLASLEADLRPIVSDERVSEIAETVRALIREGFVAERAGEYTLQT